MCSLAKNPASSWLCWITQLIFDMLFCLFHGPVQSVHGICTHIYTLRTTVIQKKYFFYAACSQVKCLLAVRFCRTHVSVIVSKNVPSVCIFCFTILCVLLAFDKKNLVLFMTIQYINILVCIPAVFSPISIVTQALEWRKRLETKRHHMWRWR